MQIATINSLRLHYAESGDPDGVPLVFANSLGTDFRIWDPLLPHLPAGLRLLRYDMRGHGLSDAPEGEYYMGDLVAEAAGLMDSLGIAGAVFVGLSIGGVVAQGLAAERPDLGVDTDDIEALYAEMSKRAPQLLHPQCSTVKQQPWGSREFAMLDATTVCVTFRQWR